MSIDVENVVALRPGQEPLRLAPRDISPTDWQRYEENIGEIFEALGMPLDTRAQPRRRSGSCARCTTPPPATTATRSC